ncbi:MAG: bifunctional DNA-formamidopyrimidine glycosylase/DNA-(apurinic or apyrimidinic site) lyase [Gemmatimonadota bacterium]
MPELPEVEFAANTARAVIGLRITRVRILHRSLRRTLSTRARTGLRGERIVAVARRGKYQIFTLASGRGLVVHFRMTGDWELGEAGVVPPYARAVFEFDSGRSLALVDPRALATLSLPGTAEDAVRNLGPDATDASFSWTMLREKLRNRRVPIKQALLDQGIVAGVGNIYAAEALWRARMDPRRRANRLTDAELRSIVVAVRSVLVRAMRRNLVRSNSTVGSLEVRYRGESGPRFNVYDREGERCRRCRGIIRRIVQGGRSTYFCPRCQR